MKANSFCTHDHSTFKKELFHDNNLMAKLIGEIQTLDSKEKLGVKIKYGICAVLCLKLCFERDWYFCNITKSGWF